MKDLVTEWLSEYSNPATKRAHEIRIGKFFTWSKKTPEQLSELSSKQAKHLLLQFQAAMKKEEMPNNSILTIITSVRSFFAYLEKPIKFRPGQLVHQEMATGYHTFANSDLGEMYNSGNAFDKALLAVGVSLGWEVSAVLDLKREDMERLVKRAKAKDKDFISFESQREKTGAARFGIVNPLALEALERYFAVDKDGTKRLFPMTRGGANKLLQRLAREANIPLTGSIRWHNLRSWLMSQLSRAGFNEFQIKYLVGKTIPITDLTYLRTLQAEIEEKYPQAYAKHLCILKYQTKNQTSQIQELEAEVTRLKLVMKGMQDLYGEELVEKAMKRLGIRREVAKRPMTAEEREELLIRIAKAEEAA